jgi:hypothetical protein
MEALEDTTKKVLSRMKFEAVELTSMKYSTCLKQVIAWRSRTSSP